MKRSITIKDVAKATGVSTMTVTRVYGKGYVSPHTREKVERAATKMGYHPNSLARGLRGCKTNSIGILWSMGGPHDSQSLVREMTFRLSKLGYVSYVADSLTDGKVVKACLRDYISRNIDGLIIQVIDENLRDPEILSYLSKISNVVIEAKAEPEKDVPFDCITRSRTKPIQKIIDHLVATGRRNICLLSQKLDLNREQMFLGALKQHNLPTENCRIINHHLMEISPDFMALLESGKIKYDAILTANDEIAAAVIGHLGKHGLRVPEDIAVVGFNDSLMSQYFVPPIASVDRRNEDFAEMAVDMLIEQIDKKRTTPKKECLDMQFIKRESAG